MTYLVRCKLCSKYYTPKEWGDNYCPKCHELMAMDADLADLQDEKKEEKKD